jgi:hypothetical protein
VGDVRGDRSGFHARGRQPRVWQSRPVDADLVPLLQKFCSSRRHQFWGETVSFRDDRLFRPSYIRGYRQLTDIYLLGLAKTMEGRLVTFDSTIPIKAVVGATTTHLHVIGSDNEGAV